MTPRERDKWMAEVLADASLPGAAVKVALRLALHLNMTDGLCNPAIATIASGTSLNHRSVERAVAILEARQYVLRNRTKGRISNEYQFATPTASLTPAREPGVAEASTPAFRSGLKVDAKSSTPVSVSANPGLGVGPTPVWESLNPGLGTGQTRKNTKKNTLNTKSGASRRSRIPENWSPSEEDAGTARREGFTDTEIAVETVKFRDHYRANGKPMIDWSSAWRNWLRNSRRFQRAPNQRTASGHLRQTESALEWGEDQ